MIAKVIDIITPCAKIGTSMKTFNKVIKAFFNM